MDDDEIDELVQRVNSDAAKHCDYDLSAFRYPQIIKDTNAKLLNLVSKLVSNGKDTQAIAMYLTACRTIQSQYSSYITNPT